MMRNSGFRAEFIRKSFRMGLQEYTSGANNFTTQVIDPHIIVGGNDGICERCGHCCMTAFLAQANILISDDKKEIGRWLALHHCEVFKYKIGEHEVLACKIPLVCKWLEFDEKNGCFKCKDYEHRPVVCREYYCKRVIDKKIRELSKS